MELTEHGFLVLASDWNEAVAVELATIHAIDLTPSHWEILGFMRNFYEKFNYLPNTRVFIKAVEKEFGTEKGNSCYLQTLFPQSPLKYVCLIAGLPKPPTCL